VQSSNIAILAPVIKFQPGKSSVFSSSLATFAENSDGAIVYYSNTTYFYSGTSLAFLLCAKMYLPALTLNSRGSDGRLFFDTT
jgi:hypothetical protein